MVEAGGSASPSADREAALSGRCGLQRIPPLSTMNRPHLMQRYAPAAYNVMPSTGRLGSVLGVIHVGRRVRARIIHAGGMAAFPSSGAESAKLFTEVLLKSGRSTWTLAEFRTSCPPAALSICGVPICRDVTGQARKITVDERFALKSPAKHDLIVLISSRRPAHVYSS